MSPESGDEPSRDINVHVTTDETDNPTMREVTNFLFDFNLLYEFGILVIDPEYDDFRFSQYVYLRKTRPIKHEQRLRVQKLSVRSPMDIVTAVGATGAVVAATVGVLKYLQDRTRLELDIRKNVFDRAVTLASKTDDERAGIESIEKALLKGIEEHRAKRYFEAVTRRLATGYVVLKRVVVELVNRTPPKRKQ